MYSIMQINCVSIGGPNGFPSSLDYNLIFWLSPRGEA
jgi:hypothetical protein